MPNQIKVLFPVLLALVVGTAAGAAGGKMAEGTVLGKKFTVKKAFFNSQGIKLIDENAKTQSRISVAVAFNGSEVLEGKKFKVVSGRIGGGAQNRAWTVTRSYSMMKGKSIDNQAKSGYNDYKLTLCFYPLSRGLLPGFIDVESADGTKVKGYFYASEKR